MKKLVFITICFLVSLTGYSQQLSLSSQYIYNDFVYNPAIAGTYDYMPLTLDVRRQWAGIKEAPITQSLSTHGYVGMNIGCGGYIINEVTGPTRRTAANVSISYRIRLSKNSKWYGRDKDKILSFGLAATLSQHKYDINKLTTYEGDDPALQNALNYKIIPDATAGIYLHQGSKYYAGLSIFNLIQTNKDLFEGATPFINAYKRQYYLSGGYLFLLKNNFAFQPSFMAEVIESTPFQIDVHAKFIYQKKYWLAIGYRLKDALVFSLGIQQGLFRFGYSYDYTLSQIGKFSHGSQEINLSIFLKYKEKGKKKFTSVSPVFDY